MTRTWPLARWATRLASAEPPVLGGGRASPLVHYREMVIHPPKFFWIALAVAFLAAGPLVAQQRLQESANGLSLDQPENDRIIIVEEGLSEDGSAPTVTGADLVEMTEELLARGKAADAVLLETRTNDVFFNQGWRDRLLGDLDAMDVSRRNLELAVVPERYSAAVGSVLEGGRHFQLAAGILRWAILRDQPLFSAAFDEFATGNKGVIAGLVEVRIENEAEESEQQQPPLDIFTARQGMAVLCGSRYGQGRQEDYDLCVRQQEAALEAINRRFGFTVGLDDPTFNSNRFGCRQAWPDDLVGQDRCELERARQSAQR